MQAKLTTEILLKLIGQIKNKIRKYFASIAVKNESLKISFILNRSSAKFLKIFVKFNLKARLLGARKSCSVVCFFVATKH